MRVVIRCDASIEIGTGHVMRCLTLAEQLRADGASVAFVSREFDGHLCEIIGNKQFMCFRLPKPGQQFSDQFADEYARWLAVPWREDAEQTAASLRSETGETGWLVVDHYGLGKDWEEFLRPQVGAIMVIDDLANRPHDCDMLLDQNLHPKSETRYNGLVAGTCELLLGPNYAMLRPQFAQVREKMLKRDGSIQRILIFMGGADPFNHTSKAVEAVLGLSDLSADVIVGRSNPNASAIIEMC
ncbi:MAG: UDP-2,4-diacetamido-2,4,6-trideoxy-beta-L-altropyranose hydrolase, partial [candidate division Zixibacteria bacterium]|nr:UDP-2,4-diacetamido-2,4,6-trideoxy-beta-L-altropyranose hydrolase [candidate division Zixibacteria bacterium]